MDSFDEVWNASKAVDPMGIRDARPISACRLLPSMVAKLEKEEIFLVMCVKEGRVGPRPFHGWTW